MIVYVCESCVVEFDNPDDALAHLTTAATRDEIHGIAIAGDDPGELAAAAAALAESIRASGDFGVGLYATNESTDVRGTLIGNSWDDSEFDRQAQKASEITGGLIAAVHKSTNLGREGRAEWNEFDTVTRDLLMEATSDSEFARLVMLMLAGYAGGVIDMTAMMAGVDNDEAMGRVGMSWAGASSRWFDREEGEQE